MVVVVRRRHAAGWAAVALATGLAAAACSSPGSTTASQTPAVTGIEPGSGQSALAGMPGSTATGPAAGAPGGTGMPGMTMSTPGAASSDAAAVPVSGNSVQIKNFAFAPAALTVKVGTKVTWTNEDTDAHTVTSQNNTGVLNSSALSTGQSYSYTFTKPGTYSYLCTIHPFMTATVTVTP